MSDCPREQKKTGQRQRLSQALRENLRRRKAQAKGRKAGRNDERSAAGTAEERPGKPHDSAGIVEDK
jgi:hypothetical protein